MHSHGVVGVVTAACWLGCKNLTVCGFSLQKCKTIEFSSACSEPSHIVLHFHELKVPTRVSTYLVQSQIVMTLNYIQIHFKIVVRFGF